MKNDKKLPTNGVRFNLLKGIAGKTNDMQLSSSVTLEADHLYESQKIQS